MTECSYVTSIWGDAFATKALAEEVRDYHQDMYDSLYGGCAECRVVDFYTDGSKEEKYKVLCCFKKDK